MLGREPKDRKVARRSQHHRSAWPKLACKEEDHCPVGLQRMPSMAGNMSATALYPYFETKAADIVHDLGKRLMAVNPVAHRSALVGSGRSFEC